MNTTTERPYVFRDLRARDIPLITNVIKAIGINEFKAVLNEEALKGIISAYATKASTADEKTDKESLMAAMGMSLLPSVFDIAEVVLNNLERCQTALNKLLSKTSNLSVEKVESLSLVDYSTMIFDFLKKEEFPDFFKVVSTFFKPEK